MSLLNWRQLLLIQSRRETRLRQNSLRRLPVNKLNIVKSRFSLLLTRISRLGRLLARSALRSFVPGLATRVAVPGELRCCAKLHWHYSIAARTRLTYIYWNNLALARLSLLRCSS